MSSGLILENLVRLPSKYFCTLIEISLSVQIELSRIGSFTRFSLIIQEPGVSLSKVLI